jgi:hypothetical protein
VVRIGRIDDPVMKTYTREEFAKIIEEAYEEHGIPARAQVIEQVNRWLERGDGAVIYRNHDFGHSELGFPRILSYGSAEAQFETAVVHVRNDSADGKAVERAQAEMVNWHYRDYRTAPVPADDQAHPYSQPCWACAVSGLPERLPDNLPAGAINWRYVLEGVYRGEAL